MERDSNYNEIEELLNKDISVNEESNDPYKNVCTSCEG